MKRHTHAPTLCGTCSRPLGSDQAAICHDCTGDLVRLLVGTVRTVNGHATRTAGVLDLLDDLAVTATRQGRQGGTGGHSKPGSRIPLDLGAIDATRALTAAITRWTTALASPDDPAPLTTPEQVTWLADRADTIRLRDWAPAMVADLGRCVADATLVIDRDSDGVILGTCACGMALRAEPTATMVTCWSCGISHDTSGLVEARDARVREVLATAREIEDSQFTASGKTITAKMVANYVQRKRVTKRGTTAAGAHLYRVGDVLDAASDAARPKPRRHGRLI